VKEINVNTAFVEVPGFKGKTQRIASTILEKVDRKISAAVAVEGLFEEWQTVLIATRAKKFKSTNKITLGGVLFNFRTALACYNHPFIPDRETLGE